MVLMDFIGTDTATANATLTTYFTNYTFTKNAIIGGGHLTVIQ